MWQLKEGTRCLWHICSDYMPKVSCYHLNVMWHICRGAAFKFSPSKVWWITRSCWHPIIFRQNHVFLGKAKVYKQKTILKKKNFNNLFNFFQRSNGIISTSSCTQSNQQFFEWEQFEINAYMSFLNAFMKEAEAALSQLDLWMIFNKLDPRALSKDLDLINMVWISLKNS